MNSRSNNLLKVLVRASVLSMISASSLAFAGSHENCDLGSKKITVKNKSACEKKKGTFLDVKSTSAKHVDAKVNEMKAVEGKVTDVKNTDVKAPEVKTPDVKTPEVKTPDSTQK
jgi:hypothetical protein